MQKEVIGFKKLIIGTNALTEYPSGLYAFAFNEEPNQTLYQILSNRLIIDTEKKITTILINGFNNPVGKIIPFNLEVFAIGPLDDCSVKVYTDIRSEISRQSCFKYSRMQNLMNIISKCPDYKNNEILFFCFICYHFFFPNQNQHLDALVSEFENYFPNSTVLQINFLKNLIKINTHQQYSAISVLNCGKIKGKNAFAQASKYLAFNNGNNYTLDEDFDSFLGNIKENSNLVILGHGNVDNAFPPDKIKLYRGRNLLDLNIEEVVKKINDLNKNNLGLILISCSFNQFSPRLNSNIKNIIKCNSYIEATDLHEFTIASIIALKTYSEFDPIVKYIQLHTFLTGVISNSIEHICDS